MTGFWLADIRSGHLEYGVSRASSSAISPPVNLPDPQGRDHPDTAQLFKTEGAGWASADPQEPPPEPAILTSLASESLV